MKVSVEVSLYPLTEEFIPVIKGFIERLHVYPEIRVETNTMSTQIFGDYDTILDLLKNELKDVFYTNKAVCVMKIIGKPEAI